MGFFLISIQQSNSDWKRLSAFLSRILTSSQTFSRPQQDDWVVPQCRFISIQTHPLALIVPGHPWGVNPLSVSPWVGSGGALLNSVPLILFKCASYSSSSRYINHRAQSFSRSVILFLRVLPTEVLFPPGKHWGCISVTPSAGLHARSGDQHWRERRGFLQRSLIPPAEEPQGGRSPWKCLGLQGAALLVSSALPAGTPPLKGQPHHMESIRYMVPLGCNFSG